MNLNESLFLLLSYFLKQKKVKIKNNISLYLVQLLLLLELGSLIYNGSLSFYTLK